MTTKEGGEAVLLVVSVVGDDVSSWNEVVAARTTQCGHTNPRADDNPGPIAQSSTSTTTCRSQLSRPTLAQSSPN